MFRGTRVLAAIVLAGVGAAPTFGLGIGDKIPLPDVKMKNVDGREIAISDAAGAKGTLVVFSCNHCPYVKAWDSRLAALGNDAVARGVGVVAINPNDPSVFPEDGFERMKEKAAARHYAFPYVVDAGSSALARAFGATHTPEAFLFNAQGALVYHGAIDDNVDDAAKVTRHFLRDALEAVLSGAQPATAESKAIGCSIKLKS